ncbi:MAG TPA: glycosyltransferase family 9 protein [Candidatus Limnocylindrales bacterium]
MPPDALRGAKRVLVVRLDNIGDVLLTSPLVRTLDAALPNAELTLLASPGGALAAPLLPWFDRVITRRAVWQDLGNRLPFDPNGELAFIDELRAADYDAAIICTSFSQTPFAAAYAAYLAGIPIRIGQAADFGGSVLSHTVEPAPPGTHQAERNLRLLDDIGVAVADRRAVVSVPAAAQATAARLLAEIGAADGDAIVVAPGASCASRRYDPTRYGRAAHQLHRATGRPVVVVGTEREVPLADAILAECPEAHSIAGRTSIPELAAIVERAALVLCGNSATLHLADALDRPVVALYSGTDRESEWAPRTAPATLLRIETTCAPCRRFDCPYEMACLAIPPDVVVDAALRLLETTAVGEGRCVASAS